MFKRHALALAIAMAAGTASAAPLVFDPTGLGAGTGSFTVDRLDWDPSGVLAVGGNSAIAAFLNGSRGADTGFQVLTHATLAGGSLNNVGVFSTTGQAYEVTAVVGFYEKVISATQGNGITTSGTADFQYDSSKGTFVRVYYSAVKNANQLAGTGFNDGTLIFDSTLSTVGGAFSTQIGPVVGNLDQSGNGNQWSTQQSVTGSGVNTTLTLNASAPASIDTNFFLNTPLLQFIIENVSLNVPFTTTDPSYAFTKADNTLYNVTSNGGTTSTLGNINGGFTCTVARGCVASGPDFMFQTDVNSSVQGTSVPEPSSLALVGLALAGVGFAARRRRG